MTDTLTAEPVADLFRDDEETPRPPKRSAGRPEKESVGAKIKRLVIGEDTDNPPAKKAPAKKAPAKKAAPRPAPVAKKSRVSAAVDLGDAWRGLGRVIAGADAPVGRAMIVEGPVAGTIIDDAIAGSVVDRWIVQPLAAGREKYGALITLVGLPLMVGLAEHRPGMRDAITGRLRATLLDVMIASAEEMEREAKREADVSAKLERLGQSGVTVDATLSWIFLGEQPQEDAPAPGPVDVMTPTAAVAPDA